MSDRDTHGRLMALLLLLISVMLMAASVLIVAIRSNASPAAWPGRSKNIEAAVAQAQELIQVVLMMGAIFLLFALGCLIMSRWGQRVRSTLDAKPSTPTANEDVWAMHKTPEPHQTHEDPEPDDKPDDDEPTQDGRGPNE